MSAMLIPSGDHVLAEGTAWITANGVSIWIVETDNGVRVELYHVGKEMENALDSAQAYNLEVAS